MHGSLLFTIMHAALRLSTLQHFYLMSFFDKDDRFTIRQWRATCRDFEAKTVEPVLQNLQKSTIELRNPEDVRGFHTWISLSSMEKRCKYVTRIVLATGRMQETHLLFDIFARTTELQSLVIRDADVTLCSMSDTVPIPCHTPVGDVARLNARLLNRSNRGGARLLCMAAAMPYLRQLVVDYRHAPAATTKAPAKRRAGRAFADVMVRGTQFTTLTELHVHRGDRSFEATASWIDATAKCARMEEVSVWSNEGGCSVAGTPLEVRVSSSHTVRGPLSGLTRSSEQDPRYPEPNVPKVLLHFTRSVPEPSRREKECGTRRSKKTKGRARARR